MALERDWYRSKNRQVHSSRNATRNRAVGAGSRVLEGALRLCPFLVMVVLSAGCRKPDTSDDLRAERDSDEHKAGQLIAPETADAEPADDLSLSGEPRRNRYLQLAVAKAGFVDKAPAPPDGSRYFVVRLTGTSRSRDDVEIGIREFVFAQNERGCISRPELNAVWLRRPFGSSAHFTASTQTEGDLAFLVPAETQSIRILIAPATGDGFSVPVGDEFEPYWPEPSATIDDGSTLRLLVLPPSEAAPALPTPPAGRKHVLLDLVIQNLLSTQGIEFTTSQQLRLVDSTGHFLQPSILTSQLGCRLDDGDVIPPGQARRLYVLYEVAAGTTYKLQYRGFELDSTVEIG